jgi:hypothetical protein
VPQFELEETGRSAGPMPEGPTVPPTPATGSMIASTRDERSWLAGLRAELTQYYAAVRAYDSWEPDQVLLSISGIGGRLIEMRADCIRDGGARATALRTKEIDPLLDHLDFQFKIHSRIVSIREFDLKLAGPQT